jgi:predicted DNA-binding ribbon-helix-helix protein
MALFTEKQYQDLDQLVKKMRQRDGELHSLNSVIRVAVEKMVNDFR